MPDSIVKKETAFHGRRIDLEVHHLVSPEGKPYTREVVVHPGAVVILAITQKGEVAMIRSWRHAVGLHLLELPAGTLEKGEVPADCARRELLEETGYDASKVTPLGSFFSSPGCMTERMYAFLAEDLKLKAQNLDEGEDIDVVMMPLAEVVRMAQTGEIVDAKTLASLLLYQGKAGN